MSPHRRVLVDLVRSHGWTRGAELGVDKGILFHLLLSECPRLHLIGVDTGIVPKRLAHCQQIVKDFSDRAQLLVMSTHDAADRVSNGSLDFVFIDADHSESAVTDDIACWRSKVRPGGWLGGHDYSPKFPGVVRAADRLFGKRVEKMPGSIWGVWL